ncbi:MAG TPA: hypothetical protein VKE22_23560 [Haliangiales bacterium]|nr:hypothetical protein [Haliangiales bacterium]
MWIVFLLWGCGMDADDPGDGQAVAAARDALSAVQLPNNIPFRDATGFVTTISSVGYLDLGNEFFRDLGTNGRRCVSCHLPNTGWTITPELTRAVFELTRGGAIDDGLGLGAIFRTNDGSNSPNADVSTLAARRRAYSMLLTRGLIRIGIGVPDAADFELVAADDPYQYASAAELSLFRRPLPTTNLRFLTTVMWDGRETLAGTDHCNAASEGGKCFASLPVDLADQSNGATTGHAQGNPLSDAQRQSIVAFETALATAQIWDDDARRLDGAGARGGPAAIFDQLTYYGINDNLGDYQTGAAFDPNVFTAYAAWTAASGSAAAPRRAIARGGDLFNNFPITISGVGGLNGAVGSPFNPPLPDSFVGSCATCHDTPNGGNHSIVAPLNIGLTDASRRTPDMPLYTLRCKATSTTCVPGATVQTTDPGRALISGRYNDIGKFKGPILRALAARAPYFHNGFAEDLDAVIDFYDERFHMSLSPEQHDDLVAFLRSL